MINFLEGLTWSRTARAIAGALEAADGNGPVLVIAGGALVRALTARGVVPIVAESDPRRLRRAGGLGFRAHGGALPIADGILRGLVARTPPTEEWLRVLRPGGVLVVLATGAATEQTRRALCAGLVDLQQRRSGRLVVTSGRRPA